MTAADQFGLNGGSAVSERAAWTVEAARPSLMSLLVEAGAASEEQLRLLAAEAMGSGQRLGEVVLGRGWIDEEGLAKLLARQWGLSFLERAVLEAAVVDRELLPATEARRIGACAIRTREDVALVVVAEPSTDRLNELRGLVDDPTFAVVTAVSLSELLDQLAAEPQEPTSAAPDTVDEAGLAAESLEANALLVDLETASGALAALAERVEQVTAGRRTAERELEGLRGELEWLRQERDKAQALAQEREQELDRERARSADIRTKLTVLLREINS